MTFEESIAHITIEYAMTLAEKPQAELFALKNNDLYEAKEFLFSKWDELTPEQKEAAYTLDSHYDIWCHCDA